MVPWGLVGVFQHKQQCQFPWYRDEVCNNVVLFASQILKASRLIVTEKPDQITFLKDAGSIGTDEISSVIALALGFSSFKVRFTLALEICLLWKNDAKFRVPYFARIFRHSEQVGFLESARKRTARNAYLKIRN